MSITSWRRLTMMGTNILIPTSVSGCSTTRLVLSMMAFPSLRHKNSLPCWSLQLTPFCCPSNFQRLAHPALLPAADHVISIHTVLARSSSDYLPAGRLQYVIARRISCDPLYGPIVVFVRYVSVSSV